MASQPTSRAGSGAGDAQDRRRGGGFHGRRKAKPLRRRQAEAYERLLPQLGIDLSVPAPARLGALFAENPESVLLEIGFGGGEHLIHRARLHPEAGFIGCEPFINGMAKALTGVEAENLANIRVFDEDAALLLDWLPPESISRVDLLYPDPWPKKRHHKRRFVNRDNLVRIGRVLKPGGEFRFASDIADYVEWTCRHVEEDGRFAAPRPGPEAWSIPWEEWLSTRYERKAISEGRQPVYLIFKRS